jgi:hypothetical protein
MTGNKIVAVSDELHRRLKTQARNLVFEYKYGVTDEKNGKLRGHVPVEHVEKLMILYGNLIIDLIMSDLSENPLPQLTNEEKDE